jgi:hypothetical protein
MSLIVFASASGAPGVTTTAVAATLNWHRSALLIEADTSKASGILPGYLAGQTQHLVGLTQLSIDHQRGQLTPDAIWKQIIPLAADRFLVPGFSNAAAGQGTTSLWGPLATALNSLEAAGTDVLVDLGRITPRDVRAPLLTMADSVILVARPLLPDVWAAAAGVNELQRLLSSAGHDGYLSVLLTESPRFGYSAAEVQKALGTPIVASIKNDERSAAVYSLGAAPTPRFERTPYLRSVVAALSTITQQITQRRTRLGERPTPTIPEELLA